MTASVAGAGLAGCEAAWLLAESGVSVTLYEMKPKFRTPAHHSPDFCELCCSNSLRGDHLNVAAGLLKAELRRLNSFVIACADETAVPAGSALAVDREGFSALVTAKIHAHPRITVIPAELTEVPPERPLLIATGPLTTDTLAERIRELLSGENSLSFFDAAAPLISADSVDMEHAYYGARYGKGEADYLNCPMDKETYEAMHRELISAKEAEIHGFEDKAVFEGCMPVEVMARRGKDTLRFGPLRPIGLRDPRTGTGAYAVAQLRRDNAAGSVYNLVGFQTHLLFSEQKRVFSMIPALHNAEFLRYGVMHRNTYINSPKLLTSCFETRDMPGLFFAGQMTGVEGYVEAIASGLTAARGMLSRLGGKEPIPFPQVTAAGALGFYISNASASDFQPMNINFGLLPPMDGVHKNEKKQKLSARALEELESFLMKVGKEYENHR